MTEVECTDCAEEIAKYACRKCNETFMCSDCVIEHTIDKHTFTCVCYKHFCRCDSEDPEYRCTSCGAIVCFECTKSFSINKETMECRCIYHTKYISCSDTEEIEIVDSD